MLSEMWESPSLGVHLVQVPTQEVE